jgi:hypothetical protein
VRTRGAGERDTVVELGGQGPLASSPRSVSTPSPSCPSIVPPQHLRVASSCGEKHPRITDWLKIGGWGESITQGLEVR